MIPPRADAVKLKLPRAAGRNTGAGIKRASQTIAGGLFWIEFSLVNLRSPHIMCGLRKVRGILNNNHPWLLFIDSRRCDPPFLFG